MLGLGKTLPLSRKLGGIPYEDETIELLSRMDVQPPKSEQDSINAVIKKLKDNNLYDKFIGGLYIFKGNKQAALLDWFNTYDLTEDGDVQYDTDIGVYSDGSSYLKTGMVPSEVLSLDDIGIGIYMGVQGLAGQIQTGVRGINGSYISGKFGGADRAADVFLNSTTPATFGVTTSERGFNHIYRNDSADVGYKVNRDSPESAARASVAVPNTEIIICAFNNNGPISNHCTTPISCVYYGEYFTEDEITMINEIIGSYIESDYIYSSVQMDYKEYLNIIPVFVDGQNYIGVSNTKIFYSSNGGATWNDGLTVTDADELQMAFRFQNGRIIYFTKDNKAYLSTNGLSSSTQITLKDEDGNNFTPHVPQDSDYPGRYFWPLSSPVSTIISDQEWLAWGNYANVQGGAAPIIVWNCIDGGDVQIAYMFGQNPGETDDGTSTGGSGGTLLGDSENSTITQHVHDLHYIAALNKWIMVTGDAVSPATCGWFEIEYSGGFNVTKTIFWDGDDRFKTGGVTDDGSYIMLASDDTSNTDLGIFKAPIATYSNIGTHSTSQIWDKQILGIRKNEDNIVSLSSFGFWLSDDAGVTWAYNSFASQYQIGGVDSDGYTLTQRITINLSMIRSTGLLVIKQ